MVKLFSKVRREYTVIAGQGNMRRVVHIASNRDGAFFMAAYYKREMKISDARVVVNFITQ